MPETKIDLINLDPRPAKSAAKEEAASPQEKQGALRLGKGFKFFD